MSRASKKTIAALPHLSFDDTQTRSFVLSSDGQQAANVFTPSALRDHREAASITSNRMFAAVLFGLFVIMLLLSFLVGINVYQALNTMAESESTQRLEQSFLANTIHTNDVYDAVLEAEGPEGKALVLRETVDGSGAYETRIYAFDGTIVQEYALESSPYAPEKAIALFDSDIFDFTYDDSLLTIQTDSGSVNVALRSGEGARS